VGRPNVGKSSLFNRILNRRIAVVDDTPGVTRDRNYCETSWSGLDFNIVDTGGLLPTSRESIPAAIHEQVAVAIEESTAIIFLVEALPGPTDLDLLIAKQLRKKFQGKIVLAVNKSESPEARNEAYNHASLGCGDPLPISALHGIGVGDLLDRVCTVIKKNKKQEETPDNQVALSLAVIGRPNAGKSSFVNKLLNDNRMIVDEVPGTTRDAIDSIMAYKSMKIKLIDTAGLRKKAQVHNDIEYYSNLRALGSVKRCDICVLLVDSTRKLGEQDLKIVSHVVKHKKGLIICWNKWDIVEKDEKTFDTLVSEAKRAYREIQHVPMVSVSALTGQRVTGVLDIALEVKNRMKKRVKPSELRNNFFTWVKIHPHPFVPSKQVRFLGIKQMDTDFPAFSVYCSNPDSIVPSYKRFLINKFQKTYDYSGCPIIFYFKPAGRSARKKESTDGVIFEKE
jgi:GTP-binding protein